MLAYPSDMLPRSSELETALRSAETRSAVQGAPSTLDLLAALLEQESLRRMVGPISLRGPRAVREPPGLMGALLERADALAVRCQSDEVGSHHALATLCRESRAAAHITLRAAGLDPARIRAQVLRAESAPQPRRRLEESRPSGSFAPADPPRAQDGSGVAPSPVIHEIDLVDAERSGPSRPLVGRARELHLLVDVLAKRRAPIACIVGEAGTGKTALIQGLAALLAEHPDALPTLHASKLLRVDPGTEVSALPVSSGFIFVFDPAPTAEMILEIARRQERAILALTPRELARMLESAPALSGQLTPIVLGEPSPADTLAILGVHLPEYEVFHQVFYAPAALETAGRLASRYPCDRFLPDRALELLDLAGARSHRLGKREVGPEEIAQVVAEAAGIPLDRVLARDAQRLLDMERHLSQWIVGHADALLRIADCVRRNYAGFRARRPVGSFLFLGPTGVGKTETAKALAHFLMGSSDAIVRMDMSEYMESHSVARLIGSPPGYVGYEEGGQLTEAVRRRPDTVVLLDEIEKAHRDLFPILLQILDEGRLTDGRGLTVDFSNTIVIMTSNLGGKTRSPAKVVEAARRAFPLELWSRIEEVLVFRALGAKELAEVTRRLAQASSERLEKERDIRYELDPSAIAYLLGASSDERALGARPLRSALRRLVEAPLAEAILAGEIKPGDRVRITQCDDQLYFGKTE